MSSVVAIVKSIVGQVVAVSPEGVRRVLIEGDRLFAGDQVDTGLAGAVSLELQDGRTIDLGRDTQWSANTPDTAAANLQEAAAQNAPSVAELQQAIAAGADPTKDLEATAAGPTAAGAAGDGGGSHSFVVLDATAGRVDPTIGFPTDGLGNGGANANLLAAGATTATNAPSVLNADTATLAEDSIATGNVLSNDSDVDTPLSVASFAIAGVNGTFAAGQTATITGVGTLVIGSNGDYTFTPDANYNGSVPQVTYTTNTGATSTLDITVTAVDDPSVLVADSNTVAEDTAASGNVLSNDSDVDNVLSVATFTVSGVNGTFSAGQTAIIDGVGSLTIAANGDYTFTPDANYNGTVPTASYTTNTGSTSTLNISVTPVDDSFTDASETVSSAEDSVATGSVLTGTSSVDGPVSVVDFTIGSTTYAAGTTATIANVGTLVIGANGEYTFTPVANYNGEVPTVSYTVTDGSGSDVTSTLNINVTPVDDSFTDASEQITIDEDTVATGSVLTGTSSVDGPVSVVNFTIGDTTYTAGTTATIANVGTLVIGSNGDYTFTPVANWNGTVPTVTYTLTDGSGDNVTSTLNISVTPVDDSFTDASEKVTIDEDHSAVGNVLTGTSSVDGPVSVVDFTVGGVTYKAGETVTDATIGSLTIAADGSYTFIPTANWNGTVPTISYTVTDGSGTDVKSTLSITVTAVDDPSVLQADLKAIAEDHLAIGNVLSNDSDVDNVLKVATFTIDGVNGTFKAGQPVVIAGVGILVLESNGTYLFAPKPDWNGSVPTINYTTNTGSTSTLNITVTPVDDSFTDRSEKVTVLEDHNAIGNVLDGTHSVDGPVSVVDFTVGGVTYKAGETVTDATIGSLTIAADGSYTFTPAPNWNGTVPTVTYTVTDGSGSDVKSTLNISVTPVDDSFTDASEKVTIDEDTVAKGSVLDGTSSVDGPVSVVDFTVGGVTYKAGETVTNATIGSLTIAADGSYTFTPAPNWNGIVPTVTYTVTDGSGENVTSTLNISVTPVDDSFTDASEKVTIDEDHSAVGNVLTGTSSVDGPVSVVDFTVGGVTYKAGETASNATIGSLTIAADGSYTFIPTANWNGTVPTISYTVTDGSGTGVKSTLSITVTVVDDPSVLQADLKAIAEDHLAIGNVLSNDSDVDNVLKVATFTIDGVNGTFKAGQPVVIAGVGILVLESNGTYLFAPKPDWNGSVPTINYTTNTGSTSTLNITVTPVDDSFTDRSEKVTVLEDHNAIGNVLDGTHSVDGPVSVVDFTVGGVTYKAGETVTDAIIGSLTIAADGSYTFIPTANWNGTVPTISYTVTDGSGADVKSTLNINVTPVDDSFTDASEKVTIDEDTVAKGSVLDGTSSVDGPVSVVNFTVGGVTYKAGETVTNATIGSLTIAADGSYTFTPAPNWNGTVPTVSYTLTDGSGDNVTSTLNISVTPVDDSFTDASEKVTIDEDHSAVGNVLTGTSSVDGPVSVVDFTVGGVTYKAGETVTDATIGSLTIAADGSYTFIPTANWNGTVPTISYTVTDGSGTDVKSTLSITVTAVDDPSVLQADLKAIAEDHLAIGNVLSNDSDVDNVLKVATFTIDGVNGTFKAGQPVVIAGVGILVLESNGTYLFAPKPDWNGSVPTINYTTNTGSTSTLNITVTPVDDSFTDRSEKVTVLEDHNAIGNVLEGTHSVDGPVSVVDFTVGGVTYKAGETASDATIGSVTIAADGSYTFIPTTNWNGTVPTISYTVTDGSGADVKSTLNINVTPVDDSFTDASEIVSSPEDSVATGSVLTGTSSVDGPVSVVDFTIGSTTYTAGTTATIANVGTLVIGANGEYTFTPVANYNGEVPTVSYTVTDGSGSDVTSTLNINVTPVDDSFTDASEIVSSPEDSVATGSVLTGTSSVDGPVSVVDFTIGSTTYAAGTTATIANVGTLVIGANGEYTFTPVKDWNGTVPTVSYTVTDGSGTNVESTLNITVTAVDDPSVLKADTNTVDEDHTATGNVLNNDLDVDNVLTVATYSVNGVSGSTDAGKPVTIVGIGTLTIAANGDYTFTPVKDWNGTVPTVTYTTNTGSTSTLTITVNSVNDAPLVNTTQASGDEDHTIAVTLGGSDVDGSIDHFTLTSLPAHGAFFADAAGTIALTTSSVISATANGTTVYFKPTGDYSGTTTFTYTSTDNQGLTSAASATGTIVVNPVSDTPSLTLTGGGTVASTDLQEVTVANVSSVDVSKLGNGVWHTDNSGGTVEIGKGSVYGTGTNSQVIELERNTGDPSNLYTNISAKAGTTYTVAFDYAPRVGALDNSVINVYWGGQLIATLNTTTAGMQHYSFDVPVTTDGTQKLEFRAVDDNSLGGLLDNINVTQVLNSGLEDNAILLSTINAHSTDVDGSETLAVTLNGIPVGATLTDGTHTFTASAGSTTADITAWNLSALKLTPPSNFNGDIKLTVTATATDGTAAPASTSLPLTVHVAAVDDASVLKADIASANEDHNATGNVLSNDIDVDNVLSVATFSVNGTTVNAGQTTTISGVGSITIAANGDYTFTPVKDWSGSVPNITYTTNTGSSSSLGINIVAVADQPSVVATTPTYASTGLAEQVWAPSTALYNTLGSGGNGASAATLIAGINGYKAAPASTTTVSDFSSANVVQGTATKATGLIYLEAGKTYTFGGTADDSLAVTVGGTTVASATWGNQSGKISGDGFTPTVSGYYTLDIYHFNQNGPGNYNLTVSVNGATATALSASNLSTFTSVDDIAKAGLTVSDLHGLNGEGYYTVASINHGQENTFIKISPITATYTDNDGSETHVTTLSGIPVNSVLMDGTGKTLVITSTGAVNLSGWDTQTLSIKPPTDFTGTLNLTVTATATEVSNNSTASDVAHIAVTVDAINQAPVVANSLVKGSEGTQLTLTWDSLHVTDNDSAASKLSIIVTQLPDAAAGKLIYNDGTGWKDVTVGMLISKAIIDANGLAFVPVAHQSGGADYSATGLGDQKADYAQFQVQGYDGADKSAVATVTVDIAPVVDAPIVTASNTQVVENNSLALGLKVTSLDTDGSETQTITKIGGIPVGATLTDGTHTFTATSSQSEVSLSGWDVSKLSYTPAPYSHGTDTLTVTAVSTENHTTQSLTTTTALNITVTAGVYEHQVGNAGTDTTPINGTASNDILIGDTNGTEIVAGKNYNIAFILDSSSSMQSSLAAAVAQLKTVFAQLSDTANGIKAGTVNVYLLDFDTNAGKSVSVDLSDKDALTKLTALLDSIKADGVTNYEDAFKTAANWFHTDTATSNTGATNLTFFITDGQPNYYQDTAATVVDYRKGTDSALSDYIAKWTPGKDLTVTLADGKHTLITAAGVVYDLVENKNGTFSSHSIGTLTSHADGYGGTEYSLTTGSSSNTPTTASISNATEGYDALSAISTVEAIGLNNGINKATLQLFDTDHVVKIGVDANDLAAAIKSSTTSIAPGDDIINGGDGNDILFGDIVNLGGSTNGIQALQAYVASKSGISDSSTVTDQQLHQYITNHVSEFNLSSTAGGSDNLSGGNGNDILFGQAGDDKLDGGAGNDILVGGRGGDTLTGGTGADTFVWLKGDTGKDTITDFKIGDGDKIDLSDLLQGENENNIDSYLKITTTDGVSTLQVSSTGKLNDAGGVTNADVTIKLTGNDWSHTAVSSLIAGSDPTIKVDHSH
ncbi:retention module-containing protein [Pseudomonas abieticivorans]|uniref:retention module-containing protein n=1 Tax=Pseudomonas abieticivorans TaxID=2931382 RepID=UPI0020BF07C5|nr:retention module-containing protein [Pseudomonas sp. PIA16]